VARGQAVTTEDEKERVRRDVAEVFRTVDRPREVPTKIIVKVEDQTGARLFCSEYDMVMIEQAMARAEANGEDTTKMVLGIHHLGAENGVTIGDCLVAALAQRLDAKKKR